MIKPPPSGYQEVRTSYPFRVARLTPGSFIVGRVNSMYYCSACGWKGGHPRDFVIGEQSHYYCDCGKELKENG